MAYNLGLSSKNLLDDDETELNSDTRRKELLDRWKNLRSVGEANMNAGLEKMQAANEQDIKPEELEKTQYLQNFGNIGQSSLDFLQAGSGANMSQQKNTLQNIINTPKNNLMERQGLADQMRKAGRSDLDLSSFEVDAEARKNKMASELFKDNEAVREFSPEEQGKMQQYFGDNAPQDMSQYGLMSDVQKGIEQRKAMERQMQQTYINAASARKIIPMEGEDGKIIQGVYDPLSNTFKPLEGSIYPKNGAKGVAGGGAKDLASVDKILSPKTGFNPILAHNAIINFNKATEGLTPQEKKAAEQLALSQLTPLINTVSPDPKNFVTDYNKLISSVEKLRTTSDFKTKNPAVGEAAAALVANSVNLAVMGTPINRESVQNTLMSLRTSFGTTPGWSSTPVEKVNAIVKRVKSKVGSQLRRAQAVYGSEAEQYAKEVFGENNYKDYIKDYDKLNNSAKENLDDEVTTEDNSEKNNPIPKKMGDYESKKQKSSLLNRFRNREHV